jgi:hypothetical protein
VLRRFLSLVLVLGIGLSNASAHSRKSPKFSRVSPEELGQLLSHPNLKGARTASILLAQNENPEKAVKKKVDEEAASNQASPIVDFSHLSDTSRTGEAALVVFAVVGLVVTIAWLPYFPILAYEAITDKENVQPFQHLSLTWSPLLGKMDSLANETKKDSPSSGALTGLRYNLYGERIDDPGMMKLGLGLELGHYSFLEEGSYWLLGPSLLFGDMEAKSFFSKIDLFLGSSFDSDLGLVSRVDLSLNYAFLSKFTVGLGLGTLYLDIKENRGVVSGTNRLGFLLNANLGYAF